MTQSNLTKNLSPFGQSVLVLDGDFSELERLSQQIERLDIESDNGLEQAVKLLSRFSECGERVGSGIKTLATTLNEARVRAEGAAQLVGTRAEAIYARKQEVDRMNERFQLLGEMARKVTAGTAELQKSMKLDRSQETQEVFKQHLPELDAKLGSLVDQVTEMRQDARQANMKALEKNAQSLEQTLISMRARLSTFIVQPSADEDAAQARESSASLH